MGTGVSVAQGLNTAINNSSPGDLQTTVAALSKPSLRRLEHVLATTEAEARDKKMLKGEGKLVDGEAACKFAVHNGHRIAYIVNGTGTEVVFLLGPGMFQTKRGFSKMTESLVAEGFKVLRFDSLGIGDSDKPLDRTLYSAETFAGEAAAVMDSERIQKAHMVGFSRDGALAVQMVKHHPSRILSITIGAHCPGVKADGKIKMSIEQGYEMCKKIGMLPDTSEEYKPVAMAHLEFAEQVDEEEAILASSGFTIMLLFGTKDEICHEEGKAMATRNGWKFCAIEGADHSGSISAPATPIAVGAFVKSAGK